MLFHKSEPEGIKDLANISVLLCIILIFSAFLRLYIVLSVTRGGNRLHRYSGAIPLTI